MASVPPDPSTDVDLLKFRLLTEMQGELTAWAKRRFSILAIVVAVVGTFGFTTVLTQIIQALVSSNVKSSVERLLVGGSLASRPRIGLAQACPTTEAKCGDHPSSPGGKEEKDKGGQERKGTKDKR
jgi:hypothetical protein